jgi:hypothetical protein
MFLQWAKGEGIVEQEGGGDKAELKRKRQQTNDDVEVEVEVEVDVEGVSQLSGGKEAGLWKRDC